MVLDPRTIPATTQVGTKLRDAAVNPTEDDFLPPVNAGVEGELGNPHGPSVVSPEIHASQGVRPVRPGDVDDDPAGQSADETGHTLVWQPQTDPVEGLTIDGDTTVAVEDTIELTATADRTNSGEVDVTEAAEWSSSDDTKATVTSGGLVAGVAAGTATITAQYGGKSDTHAVTVTAE